MLWFMQPSYTQTGHCAYCVFIAESIKYEFSKEDDFFLVQIIRMPGVNTSGNVHKNSF